VRREDREVGEHVGKTVDTAASPNRSATVESSGAETDVRLLNSLNRG